MSTFNEALELVRPRNLQLAVKAKAKGMRNSLRIVVEARRAGVAVSLAFAIVEQETSNGRNIWGCDPPPNGGTGGLCNKPVTKAAYEQYKRVRGPRGRGGMQGVGPLQLTWFEYQDQADELGGCHIAKYNIRIGLGRLAANIAAHGKRDGIRRYNGAGAAAERYADSVLAKEKRWHSILA